MTKHHYVYKSFEEGGREYIGIRTCNCLPEEDTKYFGSFYDKTFNPTGKTILFTGDTRQEVAEIEIELHNFFDVAVNSQFANKAKAVSTGFDVTGVPKTEEHKKKIGEAQIGEKNHQFGVPLTEETKKKLREALSGENNPMYGRTGEKNLRYGVTQTEEWIRKRSGALSSCSKAIIAIGPDGTQRHYGSIGEAARELKMNRGHLSRYSKYGHVLTQGPRKDWQFLCENP